MHAIACRTLGIRHLRTRPYRPQTNGKAERFIRTLLGGWAYGAIYRTSTERTAPLTDGSGTTTINGDTAPSATNRRSLGSPGEPTSSGLTARASGTGDRYRCPVSSQRVPGGVVHKLPADLREALIANTTALDAWKDITPLARNEFICWVEDAKQETTRERRIRRTQEELEEGQRRPCCWPGCKHRERTGR